MKSNTTFTASIYVGLQHGYSGGLSSIDDVRQWLQKFCNEVKLGLTLTPTEFIYVGGGEPGVIIGLINYPRFPQSVDTIKKLAITIGEGLMKLLSQRKNFYCFSDETIMLERENE